MANIEEEAKRLNFEAVTVSLIVSSFAFVAALFWRDAIKSFIEKIVPEGQGLTYQFGAAIIVTIIAVGAIYITTRYLTRIDDKLKERALVVKKKIKTKNKKS